MGKQFVGWVRACRAGRRAGAVGLLVGLVLLLPGTLNAQSVGAQASPDALKALAIRFIAPAIAGPNGQAQSADLTPGAMPSDLPMMIPVPAGANLVGSLTRKFGGQSVSWEMAFDASGTQDDLIAYYTNQLGPQGWNAPPTRNVVAHGFAPATQIPPAKGTFCKSGGMDGPYLAVTVIPTASGPTDLRVFLSGSSGGICSGMATMGMTAPAGPLDKLPALSAPAGVAIANPTGSVNTGNAVSEGIATAAATAVDLEAAYEAQLMAAGWQKTGGESMSPHSWSTWTVPGDGSYQGFLSILELPGGNLRTLHLSVWNASASQTGS